MTAHIILIILARPVILTQCIQDTAGRYRYLVKDRLLEFAYSKKVMFGCPYNSNRESQVWKFQLLPAGKQYVKFVSFYPSQSRT